MKLIAKKNFTKVPALEDLTIADQIHPRHIHKGALLEIGSFEKVEDLRRAPMTAQKQLVAQLIVSGSVIPAGDKEGVAAINAEVAADEKKAATAKKLDEQSTGNQAVNQLIALLKGFQAAPAK